MGRVDYGVRNLTKIERVSDGRSVKGSAGCRRKQGARVRKTREGVWEMEVSVVARTVVLTLAKLKVRDFTGVFNISMPNPVGRSVGLSKFQVFPQLPMKTLSYFRS
jgi:hypothetical protein